MYIEWFVEKLCVVVQYILHPDYESIPIIEYDTGTNKHCDHTRPILLDASPSPLVLLRLEYSHNRSKVGWPESLKLGTFTRFVSTLIPPILFFLLRREGFNTGLLLTKFIQLVMRFSKKCVSRCSIDQIFCVPTSRASLHNIIDRKYITHIWVINICNT